MPGRFAFTIDAKIENIPLVADGISDYLASAGVGTDIIPDIELSVDEAITNIVMHGYKGGEGTIAIACTIGPGCVRVEIRDSAPAFNPLSVPAPDLSAPLADRAVGGMGIYFIRKVMDEVSYAYVNGENVLRLGKRRPK